MAQASGSSSSLRDARFERLVREQRTSLERFTRRLGASAQDAEEIAATALLRAYQSGETHRETHLWRGWLHAVARNLWIDSVRRRRIHLVDNDHVHEDRLGSSPAVDQVADEAQDARAICEAMALLPPRQRHVIYLREIRGLSYHEIATTLELSESTVTSTLHRARTAISRTEHPTRAKAAAAFGVPWVMLRAGASKAGRLVASTAPAAGAVKIVLPVAVLAITGATVAHRALADRRPAVTNAVAPHSKRLPDRGAPPATLPAPGAAALASLSPRSAFVVSPSRPRTSMPAIVSGASSDPGPSDAPVQLSPPPPSETPPAATPGATPSTPTAPVTTAPSPSPSPDATPASVTTPGASPPASAHPRKPHATGANGRAAPRNASPGTRARTAKGAASSRAAEHKATPQDATPGTSTERPAPQTGNAGKAGAPGSSATPAASSAQRASSPGAPAAGSARQAGATPAANAAKRARPSAAEPPAQEAQAGGTQAGASSAENTPAASTTPPPPPPATTEAESPTVSTPLASSATTPDPPGASHAATDPGRSGTHEKAVTPPG
jgi:RNA polymerase sigma factor (sigma-70 family)